MIQGTRVKEVADSDRRPPPVVRVSQPSSGLLVGVFTILFVMALRLGSALLVPMTVSLMLSLLFGPIVQWLRERRIPEWLGAAFVVFGTVGLLGTGAGLLAAPAADWIQHSPATLDQVDAKIRRLIRPLKAIQQTADKVVQATNPSSGTAAPKVQVEQPGLMNKMGGGTLSAIGALLTVVFLTYFLLATGQLFRQKLISLPSDPVHQERMAHALTEIERQTSRYLLFTTIISLGVGLATWALLAACGLPNAALWAAAAAVLNFIPYVGALVTGLLVGAAALISFDQIERMLVVLGGLFLIHLVAGNLVTPAVLGRKLPLNTVALFVSLLFWGWVWGVPGAILAVPLTVLLKVICDHVDHLRPVAVLLDN